MNAGEKDIRPLVMEYFGFLLGSPGFRLHSADQQVVRFVSDAVTIDLTYDSRRSFELALGIGQVESSQSWVQYSLSDVLRLTDHPLWRRMSSSHVSSPEILRTEIGMLAELLWTHGQRILSGDQEIFARLAEQQRRDSAASALKTQLEYAREDAAAAWQRDDFAGVVEMLEPLGEHLTPSEQLRLKIARRRSVEGG